MNMKDDNARKFAEWAIVAIAATLISALRLIDSAGEWMEKHNRRRLSKKVPEFYL
ncbi:MAG: hypothetical protein HYT93_02270 [Parcubacteria group bacterium]|nr:hypothetical protein [Parcubacteria group bacterium]